MAKKNPLRWVRLDNAAQSILQPVCERVHLCCLWSFCFILHSDCPYRLVHIPLGCIGSVRWLANLFCHKQFRPGNDRKKAVFLTGKDQSHRIGLFWLIRICRKMSKKHRFFSIALWAAIWYPKANIGKGEKSRAKAVDCRCIRAIYRCVESGICQ